MLVVVRLLLVPRMLVVVGFGYIGLMAVVMPARSPRMAVVVLVLELVRVVVLMAVAVGMLLVAVLVGVFVVVLVGVLVFVLMLVLAVGHGEPPFPCLLWTVYTGSAPAARVWPNGASR
jgi:hypothetical protein